MKNLTPLINEDRTEVRLGQLTFEWDRSHSLLQVAKYDEEVFATGEVVTEELWEGFVSAVEALKVETLPMSVLKQLREIAREANRSTESDSATELLAQAGQKLAQIIEQFFEEYERTSPPRSEDSRHVSTLDGTSFPRGVHPEDVAVVLNDEAAKLSNVTLTPLNWLVTEAVGVRVVFVFYHYQGEPIMVSDSEAFREGMRTATYVNGKCMNSEMVQ